MTIAIECHNTLNVVDVLSHVASWLCHLMKIQRSFRACDIIHARVFVHACVDHVCVYMHNKYNVSGKSNPLRRNLERGYVGENPMCSRGESL